VVELTVLMQESPALNFGFDRIWRLNFKYLQHKSLWVVVV